jgi:hypothetical protein
MIDIVEVFPTQDALEFVLDQPGSLITKQREPYPGPSQLARIDFCVGYALLMIRPVVEQCALRVKDGGSATKFQTILKANLVSMGDEAGEGTGVGSVDSLNPGDGT